MRIVRLTQGPPEPPPKPCLVDHSAGHVDRHLELRGRRVDPWRCVALHCVAASAGPAKHGETMVMINGGQWGNAKWETAPTSGQTHADGKKVCWKKEMYVPKNFTVPKAGGLTQE
eukprot:Skav233148  [mRNA]  locus=scaffold1669:167064:167408:+ [translate_table: standard]